MIRFILANEELKEMLRWLFIIFIIGFSFFFYISRNIEVSFLKHEIQKLKDSKNQLLVTIENNKLKISEFTAVRDVDNIVRNDNKRLLYNQKVTILKIYNNP